MHIVKYIFSILTMLLIGLALLTAIIGVTGGLDELTEENQQKVMSSVFIMIFSSFICGILTSIF